MTGYKILQKIRKLDRESGDISRDSSRSLADEYCSVLELIFEVLLEKFCANSCFKPSITSELTAALKDMVEINSQVRGMNQRIIELLPSELIQIGKLLFQGTLEEIESSENAQRSKMELEVIGEDEEVDFEQSGAKNLPDQIKLHSNHMEEQNRILGSKDSLQDTIDFVRPIPVLSPQIPTTELLESKIDVQEIQENTTAENADAFETSFGSHKANHFSNSKPPLGITDSEVALNDEISLNVPKRTEQGSKIDPGLPKPPGVLSSQSKTNPSASTPRRNTGTLKKGVNIEDSVQLGS